MVSWNRSEFVGDRPLRRCPPVCQQSAALGCILCVASRQAERQGEPITCGDQVDFCVQPVVRFNNRLWSVFRRAGAVGMHFDRCAVEAETVEGQTQADEFRPSYIRALNR